MSYVIQAVLSNPRRPECDQITIPFPIPVDQYDKTIEMLQAIDLGFSVNRDCTVDEVNSRYSVLNTLVGTLVNIDQLDYLAKRLDGFCAGEVSQFQAMAHKLGLSEIKDFINLTYCCQQTTVITDFSDLEQIGKDHTMTLNGGAMPIDQYQAVNGKEAALQLINGGRGVITPYGVAYDNGMELEPVYNGHQFPHIYTITACWCWRSRQNGVLWRGAIRNICTFPLRNTRSSGHCSALASPRRTMPRYASTAMSCRKKWMRRWILSI